MVTELDCLARSVPDARAIADELTARDVKLNIGGWVYDPIDLIGRLLFTALSMVIADRFRLRSGTHRDERWIAVGAARTGDLAGHAIACRTHVWPADLTSAGVAT